MIEDVLRKIGLGESETKVYLALLDLGESTSGDILNKAGLRTGKIYEILSSLERKGLVSQAEINGVKRFSPADPRRVYDLLEKHKEEINEQEKNFKDIVPRLLEKIKSKKKHVNVEIFTGFDGLHLYFRILAFTPSIQRCKSSKAHHKVPSNSGQIHNALNVEILGSNPSGTIRSHHIVRTSMSLFQSEHVSSNLTGSIKLISVVAKHKCF